MSEFTLPQVSVDKITPALLNDGVRMYPDHFYDETRIGIAADILGKEFAKLTEAPDNAALAAYRAKAREWFDGTDQELSPVHDFWCTFDLLLSVKTKRLARFVTAQNVTWDQTVMPLDDLTLTWMPFMEQSPALYGDGPWPVTRIRQVFRDYPHEFERARGLNNAIKTKFGFYRSDDPITLVTNDKNQQFLLDGNGRLGTAVIDERDEIRVWHGRMEGNELKNYWVSTGTLKDLCYVVKFENETAPEVAEAAFTLLTHHLASNEAARINYHLWIKEFFPELTKRLVKVL